MGTLWPGVGWTGMPEAPELGAEVLECGHYMENILVSGKTRGQHDERVRQVHYESLGRQSTWIRRSSPRKRSTSAGTACRTWESRRSKAAPRS